jgi:predicted SprT family Zn-dependent metalloprotease
MNSIEIAALTIKQHNAQYAREREIVREVGRILTLRLFPSERIWVDIRFDYGMAEHSSSKLTLMQINGELHGTAEIRFQGLFLWQDFSTFFNDVIPHELAHVLMEVRYAERGSAMEKGHSDEWIDLVLDINSEAEPAAKVKGNFDDRAIKLHKGGIACECDCDDLDAFIVVANTPSSAMKLRTEELTCSDCHSAYRRVKDEFPEAITATLKFYESVMAEKVHHAQLSR